MTKLLTAIAAAAFALTALVSSGAEAGFNVRLGAPQGFSMLQKTGCHGGGGYSRPRQNYRVVKRSVKPKVQVARVQRAEPEAVAKIEEPQVESTASADETANEGSTIPPTADAAAETGTTVEKPAEADTAEADDATTASTKKVASKDLGCKAFFPAVGMTLSVPCK